MNHQPGKLALAIGLLAATHTFPTFAQNNNLPAGNQNSSVLEEITVYAQKREQSIMEVPLSVASYSGDALEQAKVRDLTDLQQVAPSLVFNSSSGATQSILTIRGIGTAGQNSGLEQSVGVFIDGVYRGRPGAALGDFIDVEAVEVLRGPQGTLFGRNTSAGVISVRTKKPSYEPSAKITASMGDYGYKQLQGTATGPLIADTLAASLSASWQEREGYIEDEQTGFEYNDKDRTTVRGQLHWDISDKTSLRIIADYTETDEICCAPVPVFYGNATVGLIASNPSPFAAAGLPIAGLTIGAPMQPYAPGSYVSPEFTFTGGYPKLDRYRTDRNDSDPGDDSIIDGGLSLQFDTALTDALSFTATAAHRFFETMPIGDIDGTSADIWIGGRGQDIEENSLELRLSYTSDRFDWDAGLFYFDQEIEGKGRYYWGEQGAAYVTNVGLARLLQVEGVAPAAAIGQLLASGLVSMGPGGLQVNPALAGTGTTESISYDSKSYAAFGQGTWHITDQLSWTVGVRYSEEDKKADYLVTSDDTFSQVDLLGISQNIFNSLRPLQVHLPLNATKDSYDDDNISFSTSLNYEITDDVSIYGRYAQGYKAGGINLNGTAGQSPGNPVPNFETNSFDPEDTESYEIGVKSYLFDRTLQLNATVFYQTVEDFQVNSFDGVGFKLQNAGEIEGKGLEIDYSWTPNENWILTGGLVLQDIEYAEFKDGSTTIAQQEAAGLRARAEGVVPPQDLTGERPNFVSDVTYAGSITYLHPLNNDMMLRFGTSYRYRSDYTTGQDNDKFTENDSYWIWNASIALAAQDNGWSLELWGKNLTNEEVINIGFDTPLQTGSLSAFLEAPRMWGITAMMQF